MVQVHGECFGTGSSSCECRQHFSWTALHTMFIPFDSTDHVHKEHNKHEDKERCGAHAEHPHTNIGQLDL
jgi:hypothetical protein